MYLWLEMILKNLLKMSWQSEWAICARIQTVPRSQVDRGAEHLAR